jgi:hypothetical protein
MSAAPPPYTTRSSTTRLRTTQRASCSARLASSTIWRNISFRTSKLSIEIDTDHFIAASHKDCDSTRIRAFFDNEHLVTCCTKGHFSDNSCLAQLLRCQVLKARHYAALRSYRDELRILSGNHQRQSHMGPHLNFRPANPPYRRQIILHQHMIRLIVEAPLANDQIRPSVLHSLDHIRKLFLLIIPQLLVLLHSRNIKFMFRLGPWGLKWTGENG